MTTTPTPMPDRTVPPDSDDCPYCWDGWVHVLESADNATDPLTDCDYWAGCQFCEAGRSVLVQDDQMEALA